MEILDVVDEEHYEVAALKQWLLSLPPFERLHQLGEIAGLFEAASRGLVVFTDPLTTPIKPIRMHPEIYELRRTALTKKLRFYHAEPKCCRDVILRLHEHIKVSDTQQQKQISVAVNRYRLHS